MPSWHGQGELLHFTIGFSLTGSLKNGPSEEYPLMGFCTSCKETQLHNEKLHDLYSPPNIIKVVKSRG
jgi:hypothetical protein